MQTAVKARADQQATVSFSVAPSHGVAQYGHVYKVGGALGVVFLGLSAALVYVADTLFGGGVGSATGSRRRVETFPAMHPVVSPRRVRPPRPTHRTARGRRGASQCGDTKSVPRCGGYGGRPSCSAGDARHHRSHRRRNGLLATSPDDADSATHAVSTDARKQRRRVDVTTYVTWFMFSLFVIPSVYVLRGIGGIARRIGYPGDDCRCSVRSRGGSWRRSYSKVGAPAWSAAAADCIVRVPRFDTRFARPRERRRISLATSRVWRIVVCFLAFAMIGVALLIADGVDSLERLEVLIDRFIFAVALIALVGIAEYEFKITSSGSSSTRSRCCRRARS